jgi:Ran GTPase-activating protein (RanGAP) involved in mRNA processing and transport
MSDPNDSTSNTDDDDSLSSTFVDICFKVRNNDPSILPEPGKPFRIIEMREKEYTELADALLENTNVAYIQLETDDYTKCSAEAMAKYVRTSKSLQRIQWNGELGTTYRELRHREKTLCYLLPAFQESASLKELDIDLPLNDGPSNLAFENMLTHTQSLRSLTLSCNADGPLEDTAVAAARSGFKKNTTLRELTLEFPQRRATKFSPIFTSLRDHPRLRRLCLRGSRGKAVNLAGLETVLLSDVSKITELEIYRFDESVPMVGLTPVLRALACRPTLTKLELHRCPLGRDDVRLLRLALCNIPSLQSLLLTDRTLGSAELVELAPALYHNTSIKVLNMSDNNLNDMESAVILRDIIRSNKTMTTLNLSVNEFGNMTGAVECIADGLGSNSTLTEIHLSECRLRDGGVSTLAQALGSRNTPLQRLALEYNFITSTGVGVLLDMMEQSCYITDLDLRHDPICEGASLLARALGNNTLPNLTRLSLQNCGIGDGGFIELVSALEQNTSLLQLDLRNYEIGVTERAFLALAESLPEIKVLQQVDFDWCRGLASAMPLLLAGLRKNTSLFRFHVADCAPDSVPPRTWETARCAGGWMQEMERLGYRNRFRPLIRAPKERLPPRGVWSHALGRVAILPDVIFEVLRSKPSLVPSEDTEGKEVATDTGVPKKRKRGDE